MVVGRMEGRIALITGGGTGIGAAVARLFAREGASVVVTGRREEPLIGVVESIRTSGGRASHCAGDVARMEDAERMVETAHREFGPVDALVNNAGVLSRVEDPATLTDEQWDWQMDTNVRGAFHLTKFAIPDMVANRHGTIVTIASLNAHVGSPGYGTYSATKGALVAYSLVLAMQYAQMGIRSNTVSPGIVDTPMASVDRPDFEGMRARLDALHPLGRIGTPEDVANAVLFLSCGESAWVTGQDLVVDGGFSVRG